MEHVPPAVPHVVSDRVRQVFPWQHPSGHVLASQRHMPLTQCWPGPHAVAPGAEPHTQTPAELQRSEIVVLHAPHESPLVPHAVTLGVVQCVPEQQPEGQLIELHPSHAPLMHICPAGHMEQLPPPLPHAPVVLPGWQTVPWQQPAHDDGSQTHDPIEQCCPGAH